MGGDEGGFLVLMSALSLLPFRLYLCGIIGLRAEGAAVIERVAHDGILCPFLPASQREVQHEEDLIKQFTYS